MGLRRQPRLATWLCVSHWCTQSTALLLEPAGSSLVSLACLQPPAVPAGEGKGMSAQPAWAWTPAWPLPCSVTLSKSLSFSGPSFPHSVNWR